MKKLLITMMALVVALALPLVLNAQEIEPATVVADHVKAFKTGDLDAAYAYFADDAVYHLNFMDETYTGAVEIRAWWEDLVAQNFDIEVEVLNVEGDAVTTKTKTWVDFTREMGIAPLEATEVYIVRDGKKVRKKNKGKMRVVKTPDKPIVRQMRDNLESRETIETIIMSAI